LKLIHLEHDQGEGPLEIPPPVTSEEEFPERFKRYMELADIALKNPPSVNKDQRAA